MTTGLNQGESKPVERPEMRMNDQNWRTYQRYVGKKLLKEGSGVVMPGGVVVDGRPWRGFKHSVQIESYVMNRPEELLLNPDPRCRYCWRPREDPKHSTEGLVKTGRLRPVEYSEINPESEIAQWCYDYSGSGSDDPDSGEARIVGLVAVGNMALFEVQQRWSYEWYDAAVDQTFSALQGLAPGFEEAAESLAQRTRGMRHHGSSISVEEGDTQNVEQEKRNPIGPGAPFGHVSKTS
jgi:hypothetical protein